MQNVTACAFAVTWPAMKHSFDIESKPEDLYLQPTQIFDKQPTNQPMCFLATQSNIKYFLWTEQGSNTSHPKQVLVSSVAAADQPLPCICTAKNENTTTLTLEWGPKDLTLSPPVIAKHSPTYSNHLML
jgi:hypothetical protein